MRTTRARAKEATKSGEAGSSAPESSDSSYSKLVSKFELAWNESVFPLEQMRISCMTVN